VRKTPTVSTIPGGRVIQKKRVPDIGGPVQVTLVGFGARQVHAAWEWFANN